MVLESIFTHTGAPNSFEDQKQSQIGHFYSEILSRSYESLQDSEKINMKRVIQNKSRLESSLTI